MDYEGKPNGSYRSRKVCVIGAGAAGLVAARELTREGHRVVVSEQNTDLGGVWLYNSDVEDDPLGQNPHRKVVHSSLYASLRANLPREIMGFVDYPLVAKDGRDARRFPGHREILLYLNDFARDFNLVPLIQFNTRVEYVGMANPETLTGDGMKEKNIEWLVRSRRRAAHGHDWTAEEVEVVFDAVVVCNGHYTEPRIAQIPGMHKWPGKKIHSHNYRVPDPFRNEVVVVIGNSFSGYEISLELINVAKEVHLSARSASFFNMEKSVANHVNMKIHSMVKYIDDNGNVTFEDGTSIIADSIIHCTGYSYSFPFLDTKGIVTVDDNRVGPLYEHVFPPLLSPSLAFIGIPLKVITFPFFEIQSKWVACILSGKSKLPLEKDMMKSVEKLYSFQEVAGISKRHTHYIIDDLKYYDWIADICGGTHFEEWRKEIALEVIDKAKSNPEVFRDS